MVLLDNFYKVGHGLQLSNSCGPISKEVGNLAQSSPKKLTEGKLLFEKFIVFGTKPCQWHKLYFGVVKVI